MSEKGQGGEALAVGTGTVLAAPGVDGGTATSAPPKYEGRQPTEAERAAGRWLDEPKVSPQPQPPEKYEGRQPTEAERAAGRWLDEPTDKAGEGGTEWIDDRTFIGPGGMPFEFQPTAGEPAPPAAGQSAAPTDKAGEGGTEWIDDKTFIGPGGMPFEFQPTAGEPAPPAAGQPAAPTDKAGEARAPGESRVADEAAPAAEPRRSPSDYGRPGAGPTKVEPPDVDPEPSTPEEAGDSVLRHIDTKSETPTKSDDQPPVMS